MSLAKPSPVCALLPAKEEVRLLLDNLKTKDVKQEPAMLQTLQSSCPILFSLVKNLKVQGRSLPSEFDSLLSDLWQKSIAPFNGTRQTSHHNTSGQTSDMSTMPTSQQASDESPTSASASGQMSEMCSISTSQQVGEVPPTSTSGYTTDVPPCNTTNNNSELSSWEESTSYWPHLPKVRDRGMYPQDHKNERQACRKLGKSNRILLPGTVTLHCQHGMNI